MNFTAWVPSEEDFKFMLELQSRYTEAKTEPDDVKNHWEWTRNSIEKTDAILGEFWEKVLPVDDEGVYQANVWSKKLPQQYASLLIKSFIIAVMLDWDVLIKPIKMHIKIYNLHNQFNEASAVWQSPVGTELLCKALLSAQSEGDKSKLTEAIEKHNTLNLKLFTRECELKTRVRNKMQEIIDAFLADLKEQEVKIKVEDILITGSNASYNYTKNSDIDLHIIANTSSVNYPVELGSALYSAYRSIFNKNLDIKIYGIPVEVYVETEGTPRVSNGVYSVKKDKWIKKPVQEDIPEYDKEALNMLVDKWEEKYLKLVDEIKADKLQDEKKVVKLIEEIYEKLRKKGIAKGEYSTENLAFKELRNKGYLDKLKEYKYTLTSKRLSLEEQLHKRVRNKARTR